MTRKGRNLQYNLDFGALLDVLSDIICFPTSSGQHKLSNWGSRNSASLGRREILLDLCIKILMRVGSIWEGIFWTIQRKMGLYLHSSHLFEHTCEMLNQECRIRHKSKNRGDKVGCIQIQTLLFQLSPPLPLLSVPEEEDVQPKPKLKAKPIMCC